MDRLESAEAIAAVDELLASVGLEHGRRTTLAGSWSEGERVRRKAPVRKGREQPAPIEVVRAPWKQLAWLRHGFSTRGGGLSEAYGGRSLNLGWTKEDEPRVVAQNRELFLKAVGSGGMPLVTVRQVHSGIIRRVGKKDGALEGRLQTDDGGGGPTRRCTDDGRP